MARPVLPDAPARRNPNRINPLQAGRSTFARSARSGRKARRRRCPSCGYARGLAYTGAAVRPKDRRDPRLNSLASSAARDLGLSSPPPRELYLFALYRLLEAVLLGLAAFGPNRIVDVAPGHPELAQSLALGYAVAAIVLLLRARNRRATIAATLTGIGVDIAVAAAAVHLMPTLISGIALMLLFNVGAASLLLPWRHSLGVACAASVAIAVGHLLGQLFAQASARPLAELMMFAVSFLAMAALTQQLRQRVSSTQALADRRGEEATRLAEVNALIIRRMRTGVLLVDGKGEILVANEAAMLLLGEAAVGTRVLSEAAPELALRMSEWLRSSLHNETPMQLGNEQFELVPRFARLLAKGEDVLIFLDDTSQVSRRAESLTLAAMGRFSASLAHEIRNPLAAISYAAQLVEESPDLAAHDRQMVQIILKQCMRTNSIVESVLGLARRERACAEHLELTGFLRGFIEEFRQTVPDETDNITLDPDTRPVAALVDSKHLHQVLTALIQNARRHGHLPGKAARITLSTRMLDQAPVIEIADEGPGIPEQAVAQLFRPFFTTSEHGTGLGLYIARELCRANGATLDHVPSDQGGCRFRITLPSPHVLLPA